MNILRRIILILFIASGSITANGQNIAVSNNAVFDLIGSFSAGIDIPVSNKNSVELYASIRPWKRSYKTVHKHFLGMAQYRIWPCQIMNGFFYGPYAMFAQYNMGNKDLFLGLLKGLKQNRYEGYLVGGGMGVGYQYAIANHFNIGVELGVGYVYCNYKKSDCEICGTYNGKDTYNYVGVSKLGLSLIYVF